MSGIDPNGGGALVVNGVSSVITPAFATGAGWTIVAPSSGFANGSAATFPGGGVARFTLSCNGSMSAASLPMAQKSDPACCINPMSNGATG